MIRFMQQRGKISGIIILYQYNKALYLKTMFAAILLIITGICISLRNASFIFEARVLLPFQTTFLEKKAGRYKDKKSNYQFTTKSKTKITKFY